METNFQTIMPTLEDQAIRWADCADIDVDSLSEWVESIESFTKKPTYTNIGDLWNQFLVHLRCCHSRWWSVKSFFKAYY